MPFTNADFPLIAPILDKLEKYSSTDCEKFVSALDELKVFVDRDKKEKGKFSYHDSVPLIDRLMELTGKARENASLVEDGPVSPNEVFRKFAMIAIYFTVKASH